MAQGVSYLCSSVGVRVLVFVMNSRVQFNDVGEFNDHITQMYSDTVLLVEFEGYD